MKQNSESMAAGSAPAGRQPVQLSLTNFEDNIIECRALIVPESDGWFSAYASRLPGIVSGGATIDEAVAELSEAFAAAISIYRENGEEIPWTDDFAMPPGAIKRWILVDV